MALVTEARLREMLKERRGRELRPRPEIYLVPPAVFDLMVEQGVIDSSGRFIRA